MKESDSPVNIGGDGKYDSPGTIYLFSVMEAFTKKLTDFGTLSQQLGIDPDPAGQQIWFFLLSLAIRKTNFMSMQDSVPGIVHTKVVPKKMLLFVLVH